VETIRGYLEGRGYQVFLASNGSVAIDMTIAQKPDIILMDIQMPEMDGLTAIQLIRVNPEVKHIPIIALTAFAMPGDREKCLEAGANEYLSKPVRLKELFQIIQNIISKKNYSI
jgi:CheY-like chemotaxis protein